MPDFAEKQILTVASLPDLISTPFSGEINAICWKRELQGDFEEIAKAFEAEENIVVIEVEELTALELSERGKLAREIILSDLKALESNGASPTLNLIKHYDRDESYPFFPTDVYSFHVDRSPIPTATYLCTYFGDASEILPNSEVEQKILVPEIRDELRKLYDGPEDGFDAFLEENFFDLHYRPKPNAKPVNLGVGNIWKLAVDCPSSEILPSVHRAPDELSGQPRLLLIC